MIESERLTDCRNVRATGRTTDCLLGFNLAARSGGIHIKLI